MIPRTLHRIWLGGNPIPEEYEAYWRKFQRLHPRWELRTWREEDLTWLENKSSFDESPTLSEKSDVARFEILLQHGGVYVDVDVEPLKPFDGGILNNEAVAGWEYGKKLGTAVLASAPGSQGVETLVKRLPQWAAEREGCRPDQRTGPLFLTTMWWKRSDVTRLPRDRFYPYGWWEPEKRGGPYPRKSYCVHHWAHSWKAESE